MAALPASVERLKFRNTGLREIQNQSHAVVQAVVSRLAEIDFSDNNALRWTQVHFATKAWPHVKTIKMNNTTFLGPPFHFLLLSQQMPQMEVLEANGVPLYGAWNINLVCQKLTNLRRLSIARCWQLSDVGVLRIASTLTKLESVDISGCTPFTQVAFFAFANLRATLRFLDVSDTNVDSDSVDVLRLCLPACDIVH